MIIETADGRRVDTESDLSGTERHVLQKVLNWRDLATSRDQFRAQTARALERGWNHSGPLRPSATLVALFAELERQLTKRLQAAAEPPAEAPAGDVIK